MKIIVRKPSNEEISKAKDWPIWTCEPSTFDWHHDETETCYIIKGEAIVKSKNQEVSFGHGDLVIFPKDLDCTWTVNKTIKKNYSFS
jgi:hypothetical protein